MPEVGGGMPEGAGSVKGFFWKADGKDEQDFVIRVNNENLSILSHQLQNTPATSR